MDRSSELVVSAICDEIARTAAVAGADTAGVLQTIGPLLEWVLMNEAGPIEPDRRIGTRAAHGGDSEVAPLTVDAVSAYLRERFGDSTAAATDVRQIVGGFSRTTTVIGCHLRGEQQQMVLRQVVFGQPAEKLVLEYEIICFTFEHGLAAPEPLWIEPAPNALGGPFFATRRCPGANVGDVFGAFGDESGQLGLDLAAFLGRLHSIDAAVVSVTPGRSMRRREDVLDSVEACFGRLEAAVDEPVPLAVELFRWLRENVPAAPARPSVVHGDVGPHNVLVDAGRLTAVLDWERSHVGDPAEDLVYLRPALSGALAWEEFMVAYVASGGGPPAPGAERFYRVWQDVWRYVACMQLRAEFEHSGRLSSAFAGRIFAPRFLGSAASSAFGELTEAQDGVTAATSRDR
jgi:aminoglycoside phosphotransferase (APT) family kinase protein